MYPTQAGEGKLERTVMLYGAHPDAGSALLWTFSRDPSVVSVVELQCDYVSCSPRRSGLSEESAVIMWIAVISILTLGIACVGMIAYFRNNYYAKA